VNNLPHRSKHPKTSQSNLQPCLHRSGLHSLVKNSPHASISSCDAISTIFSRDCTKHVAYLGEDSTPCVETPEDVCPTIFGHVYTEVVHITWQKPHLMLQTIRSAHSQSSNMLTQSFLTTWRTIYLIQWNIRKHSVVIFNHTCTEVVHMVWLRAHLMQNRHLAMPYRQSSIAIAHRGSHILVKIIPHALKHPKMSGSQSSIILTPKWSI
jgi:hypothetical protein